MRSQDIPENQVLGAALVLLGVSLGAAAAVASLLAFDHMNQAAALCGPVSGHCVRCLVAVALLIAAIGTLGAGVRLMRPVPALQRAG